MTSRLHLALCHHKQCCCADSRAGVWVTDIRWEHDFRISCNTLFSFISNCRTLCMLYLFHQQWRSSHYSPSMPALDRLLLDLLVPLDFCFILSLHVYAHVHAMACIQRQRTVWGVHSPCTVSVLIGRVLSGLYSSWVCLPSRVASPGSYLLFLVTVLTHGQWYIVQLIFPFPYIECATKCLSKCSSFVCSGSGPFLL